MNSQLQTALDIKSHTTQTNPFIFSLHANSTSQQHIQLSISSHILKKLSLIDISQSRQLADLFKQCLLDVVQNPLIDLKSHQTIVEIVYFLQYWQLTLGKISSWPHTRTCFYYLQEKLKKHKYFQTLDYVRLKRAQLEPNKKQFLTQIIAEPIHSHALQEYIIYLKQIVQDFSQNSFSFNSNPMALKSQEFIKSQKIIQEKQEKVQHQNKLQINSNILYSDSVQYWKQVQNLIQQINTLQKNHQTEVTQKLKDDLNTLFETYLLEKLPIYINWMKSKKYSKEKIIQELNFRRSIVLNFGVKEHTQIFNLTISRIIHNYTL